MTDILTHEEFEALLKEEGDMLPRPAVIQSFDIEETFADDFSWDKPKMAALMAVSLNVAEPHMYTDRKGKTMVVLPLTNLTYDTIQGFFPVKKAWVYTISDTVGEDLDERGWFFRYGQNMWEGNEPLPAFKLEDTLTH